MPGVIVAWDPEILSTLWSSGVKMRCTYEGWQAVAVLHSAGAHEMILKSCEHFDFLFHVSVLWDDAEDFLQSVDHALANGNTEP